MKRAIDAAETLVKFTPKGCDLSHAVVVIGSFTLAGFLGGVTLAIFIAQ